MYKLIGIALLVTALVSAIVTINDYRRKKRWEGEKENW